MKQEIAVSSNGQLAEWNLAIEPLKHLTQNEIDSLIERIDSFVFAQIENTQKENK